MINHPTGSSPTDGPLLRSILLLALCLWSALLFSLRAETPSPQRNGVDRDAFVASISEISILERHRSGVPASITAAQAILESNWGRAPIAIAGNNYFGIKCKSYWTGPTVLHEDDDYDANGKLTQSCFRAYDSVEDSFRDHSDFLRNSDRYARLFELEVTDYRAWAHGLRACGYATDPAYADKLIAIIERLELYTLDWTDPDATDWLMSSTEDGRSISQQRTWMDIPAEYTPSGQGAAVVERGNE